MPFLEIFDTRLEYRVTDGDDRLPWLVFLHEGLGSVELWRGFPERIAEATGCRSLVYSRHGHGWSDPLTAPRRPDFMTREANVILPAIRETLAVDDHLLIGHSDGASISLIAAGSGDGSVKGVVALAPHVFVEEESLAGGEAARRAFEETELAEKMARYHHDPSATFYGWYDVWQSPGFKDWNIEGVLETIECPLLVIQGADDQYGTVAQLEAIEAGTSGTIERIWMENCGHSPHLDRPTEVEQATVRFVQRVLRPSKR